MKHAKFLTAAVLATLAVGCSHAEKEADKALSAPSAETQTAARQEGAANVVEINFDKGSSVLTEGSRAAIADMVAKAKQAGEVDDIKVLAWADQDYPSDAQKKLSKGERDLASKRATALKDYIKAELAVSDVDTYNMAERPAAIEKLFNTSDAQIKRTFENAGVTSADGKAIVGKASRAVVMATLEK